MILEYKNTPLHVNTVKDFFTKGEVYGRLRSNMFYWDWGNDQSYDTKAMGIGGSFVYKTASLSGLTGTLGFYTTQNPGWFREDASNIGALKSGKDTLNRAKVKSSGQYGMNVLAQAYLKYNVKNASVTVGRQMFDSVYTASNDTKMIPNTFDGVTANIKELPQTTISLAYFDKQKLRDHTSSHDVLVFNGGSSPASWAENDDSGVNKNLTTARIGNDNDLFIVSLKNNSIKNTSLHLNYLSVPSVLSNITLETHYKIAIHDGWSVAPGVRYMKQYDNLGASYNVAGLKGDANNHHGYTNPTSLDTSMIATRLDIKKGAFLGRVGYSKIDDKADIVAPWRGFPTGGFTRAMAQVNWYANTKTTMVRASYDFGKADILPGFSVMARYSMQDFDDAKDDVQADSNVLHIDLRQNIGRNLEAKIRLGFVDMKDDILKSNGTSFKNDTSYNEYRFELNYFF